MSAPPKGAVFQLLKSPDLHMTEDEARRILRAPVNVIGRSDARLDPVQDERRIAHDLGRIAAAWWRRATAFKGFSSTETPCGSSPSNRSAYCRSVAAAADRLLVAMGAAAGAKYPVMCQRGAERVFVQASPDTAIDVAIGNLIGPMGVKDPAVLKPEVEAVELNFAPAMATASTPGAFPEARRVDDQVLAAAVAGVALLRDWAAISAQAWTLRAAQAGRKKGGRLSADVREWAFWCLAERFNLAFGLPSSGWKTPIRGGGQTRSYECFAAFVVAFCEWFAARCGAEQLEEMGPDSPAGVTVDIVRKVAPKVAKHMKKAKGDETYRLYGLNSIRME